MLKIFAKLFATTVVTVMFLSSCSGLLPPRGQTAEQAIKALENIGGVSSATYEVTPWERKGVFTTTGNDILLTVKVEPNYHIVDTNKFFEYVAQTVWTITDERPNGFVNINIVGGVDPNYGWFAAGVQTFGTTEFVYVTDTISFSTTTSNYEQALGNFPGVIPEEPKTNLTATGEPSPYFPPAVRNVVFSDSLHNNTTGRITLRGDLASLGDERYEGMLTITWLMNQKVVKVEEIYTEKADESIGDFSSTFETTHQEALDGEFIVDIAMTDAAGFNTDTVTYVHDFNFR